MNQADKDKLIKKEKAKLNKIFKTVEEDTYKTVEQLINNAAFLSVTLMDLQDIINTNGIIETYQNGPDQSGTRISPAVTSYNKLITNYNAVVKTLLAINPQAAKVDDGFAEFVKK
jgi:hypothetical protein